MSKISGFRDIPVDDLQYDLQNPRLAELREYEETPTPEQVAFALHDSTSSFIALKEAIRTYRGIINPIKVNDEGGELVVFEGNTRLAIYRSFVETEEPGDWTKIPCVVYDNLSTVEVEKMRVQEHLVGARDWGAYAKAKYLYYLSNEELIPLRDLSSLCGGNRTLTAKTIRAYDLMERHYRQAIIDDPELEEDQDFHTDRFQAFVQYQIPKVESACSRHGITPYEFSAWVAKGKFKRLEHIRELPQILDDERAFQAFKASGSREALRFIDLDLPELMKEMKLSDICRGLPARIDSTNTEDIKIIKSNEDMVDNIRHAAAELQSFIEEFLRGD